MRKYITNHDELAEDVREKKLSRTTIWRAKKRGWYCPDYHQRWMPGVDPTFSVKAAYQLSTAVFYRHFWPAYVWLKDDLIQEAVIRLWEISGGNSHPGIQYGTARNAMRNCVAKWKTRGEIPNDNILFFGEDDNEA